MQPIRFYVAVLGFFIAALVFGVLFFIFGMGEAAYLTSDGVGYGMHYIDKPRYDSHMQGLIFTLSFLAAGILLLFLIFLPSHAGVGAQPVAAQPGRRAAAAPQPAAPQRAARQPAPPQPQAAAAPPQPQETATPTPQAEEAEVSPTMEIEAGAVQASQPPPPPEPERSVEEEVLTKDAVEEFPIDDIPDSRYEDSGEEDVVYGNGRVTDDSIWDFIHTYTDSAIKFLYRKTLDNKALTPNEEDIYRRWEMRGMSRAKVREFVMEVMGWKSLPDDFPHNIWRELRDQIFDLKSKAS